MALKLSAVVLEALSTKDELTLKELYLIISDNSDFSWETNVMKHRVRSALYSLKVSKKIERSDDATYKLI